MTDEAPHTDPAGGRSWLRRFGRGLLLYAVVPYLVIVIGFTLLQRRFIYQPTRASSLRTVDVGLSPVEARDVTLQTDDGLTLHGWLFTAAKLPAGIVDVVGKSEQDRLLIYFSGNAGHRGYRVADFREFTGHGFDVLVFDYRGYGDNPGSPSQQAMQSDARSIWQFAVNELHADPGRTVLYGESMGGAVATHLAAEMSESGTPPAALITNSTFASLAGTVRWHYPMFPFDIFLLDRWSSAERMPHVTCPVLMFHGTEDDIVPLSQGRELFAVVPAASATGIPKQFVELPGSGHNNIPVSVLEDEVGTLVSTVFGRHPPAD